MTQTPWQPRLVKRVAPAVLGIIEENLNLEEYSVTRNLDAADRERIRPWTQYRARVTIPALSQPSWLRRYSGPAGPFLIKG